ncbi:MAG TPA: hypothetical protein VGX94_06775, partial [Terriglobia bacterium]|nr:hypothetical protein [Terriglobia bacterium]
MRQTSKSLERGVGKGAVIALMVILLLILFSVFKLTRNPAPTIKLAEPVAGIGLNSTVRLILHDAGHRITRVRVEVGQEGKWHEAPVTGKALPAAKHGGYTVEAAAQVGRRAIPQLTPGRAEIRVTALNDSWGRFFRGGLATLTLSVPVRFMPPQVEVLTSQHYINLGGCDMIVFNVSPGATKSGVQVGQYFFPSFPVTDSKPLTRIALFAFPYDVDPSTPARIVADDDAGNQTVASFTYKVFPAKWHQSTIPVDDAYMQ